MDDRLRTLERTDGVFLRHEARQLGYDDKTVRNALRTKLWHRVRHGAYCFGDTWAATDPTGRHLILARAVMRSLAGRVALSHTSALVAHGVDVWGADLSRVHVTRLDGGAGRVERDVVHHEGTLVENDLIVVNRILMTTPVRAVLEAGTVLSVESALVSTDSALHRGLCDPDELGAGYPEFSHWPGAQRLQLVLRLADGRSESVGETRSRHVFWTQNLPAPELQFHVHDDHGRLIGITDFAWPEHGMLGEFDGKVKYARLLKPGQEPGEVVFEEKRREDLLREYTGFGMGRMIWADLANPVYTGARFARLMRLSA